MASTVDCYCDNNGTGMDHICAAVWDCHYWEIGLSVWFARRSLGLVSAGLARDLLIPALNLALVSFVSLMLTARSFAAKNGYEINADAEFRALGVANLMSGLSQGFAISGADSRTAVNDSSGGKASLFPLLLP